MSELFTPTTGTLRSVYIDARMAGCDYEGHLLAKRRREVADEFDRWLATEHQAARADGFEKCASQAYIAGLVNQWERDRLVDGNPYRAEVTS